ncbi:hypothetical protein OF83DRAFT_186743 [Amylostereum chailletii]|nr:hypothetical protein OF83DRAFT_186743 [Amylostereum chailletii]
MQTATLFFGGIAGAIFLFQKIRGALSSTRASYVAIRCSLHSITKSSRRSLQERGWTISKSGMSIKTNKRMDHSRYLDNTTRSGPFVFSSFIPHSHLRIPQECHEGGERLDCRQHRYHVDITQRLAQSLCPRLYQNSFQKELQHQHPLRNWLH